MVRCLMSFVISFFCFIPVLVDGFVFINTFPLLRSTNFLSARQSTKMNKTDLLFFGWEGSVFVIGVNCKFNLTSYNWPAAFCVATKHTIWCHLYIQTAFFFVRFEMC